MGKSRNRNGGRGQQRHNGGRTTPKGGRRDAGATWSGPRRTLAEARRNPRWDRLAGIGGEPMLFRAHEAIVSDDIPDGLLPIVAAVGATPVACGRNADDDAWMVVFDVIAGVLRIQVSAGVEADGYGVALIAAAPGFPVPPGFVPLGRTGSLSGVPVGLTHGHAARKAPTLPNIEEWWKGQVMGDSPLAEARILFVGHGHHFFTGEGTGRTVFQLPALDPGSYWFYAQSGKSSPSGQVGVVVSAERFGRRGWGDLAVHTPAWHDPAPGDADLLQKLAS